MRRYKKRKSPRVSRRKKRARKHVRGRRKRNPAIPIKYMRGKLDWTGNLWSAAAVRQVLKYLQPYLRQKFGEYSWTVEPIVIKRPGRGPSAQGYEIVARSGKDSWEESWGRTPQKALKAWHPGWSAIKSYLDS